MDIASLIGLLGAMGMILGAMISAVVDAEKEKFEKEIEKLDAGELTGEDLANAKIEAFDTMGEAMTEGLEGLSIAGFDVTSLIGGDVDDPVECLALKF